jgi:hypothetical protein
MPAACIHLPACLQANGFLPAGAGSASSVVVATWPAVGYFGSHTDKLNTWVAHLTEHMLQTPATCHGRWCALACLFSSARLGWPGLQLPCHCAVASV